MNWKPTPMKAAVKISCDFYKNAWHTFPKERKDTLKKLSPAVRKLIKMHFSTTKMNWFLTRQTFFFFGLFAPLPLFFQSNRKLWNFANWLKQVYSTIVLQKDKPNCTACEKCDLIVAPNKFLALFIFELCFGCCQFCWNKMESSKEDRNQSSGSNFPSQHGRPNNNLMNETTIIKAQTEQNNSKNKNNSSNSVSPLNFDTQTIEGRGDSPMSRNTPSKQTSPYPSDNESSLYLSAKSQPSSPSFTKPPRNRSKKHRLQLQQQNQTNSNTNNKKKRNRTTA